MGQQQLLLIVLAIVITGVAIGLANQIFDSNAEQMNKEYVVSELVNLGTLAQQFYNRPSEMGGGSSSFKNWIIPTGLDSTLNGTYEVIKADNENLVLMGFPNKGLNYNWYVESEIIKDRIKTQVMH